MNIEITESQKEQIAVLNFHMFKLAEIDMSDNLRHLILGFIFSEVCIILGFGFMAKAFMNNISGTFKKLHEFRFSREDFRAYNISDDIRQKLIKKRSVNAYDILLNLAILEREEVLSKKEIEDVISLFENLIRK